MRVLPKLILMPLHNLAIYCTSMHSVWSLQYSLLCIVWFSPVSRLNLGSTTEWGRVRERSDIRFFFVGPTACNGLLLLAPEQLPLRLAGKQSYIFQFIYKVIAFWLVFQNFFTFKIYFVGFLKKYGGFLRFRVKIFEN